MSRGGFVARGDAEDAMAIWMTASMSSFVGPEPAGGGFEGVAEGPGTSPAEEDEGRVEERAGGACGGDCAGVEAGCVEGGPEEWRGWTGEGRGEEACYGQTQRGMQR